MTLDLRAVRPPVITKSLREKLQEFLGFRHVIRNVYPFDIDRHQVEQLVEKLPSVHNEAAEALQIFVEFLAKAGLEG